MKILIRFDDICPSMDWEQWGRAEEILNKYKIKPLIGVIPDNLDSDLEKICPTSEFDFWDWVKEKQKQGYKIAMHGLNHVYDSNSRGEVNISYKSEFAGHSYEIQYEKIKKGKMILAKKGLNTDVFFAPSHSYDDNTIKALAANGFKYMSDSLGLKPIMRHGLCCLPCHFCGSKLPVSLEYQTIVFHAHEWAIPRNSREYNLFEKICRLHKDDIISFDSYIKQEMGSPFIQNAIQTIIVYYNRKIWPKILKFYLKIK